MTHPSRSAVEHGLRTAIRSTNSPNETFTIDERMNRYVVPGMSVAVIEDGEVQWAHGYGHCRREGPEVTPTTAFQAASISKVVNALGILALWRRGAIDLDAPVNSMLRTWAVPDDGSGLASGVTVRRLLAHTAGLGVPGFGGYEPSAALPTTVQILTGEPPCNSDPVTVLTPPGAEFHYSGGGTTVLQLLLEEVTGTDYATAMHELVLEPFAMADSRFEQPLADDRFSAAAHGHDATGDPYPGGMRVFPHQAAAGLWTTALDLARLVIVIQQVAAGERSCVIDPATAEMMLSPVAPGPHGLGPEVIGEGAARRFRHNGTNRGYCSQMEGFLDRRSGAVVLTNADGGNSLIGEVLRGIAHVNDWAGFEGITITAAEVPGHVLDGLAGRYVGARDARMHLVHDDGRLFSPSPYGRRLLVPLADDLFVDEETAAEIAFEYEGGDVVARVLVDGEEIMAFRKTL